MQSYLNLSSTQAFIAAAKSYLTFCEQIITTPANFNILKDFQPHLADLYFYGSKLEPVPGPFPMEWQELDPKNDGAYDALLSFLGSSVGSQLRCHFILQPLSTDQQSHSFFVDEHLADIYLQLHDDIYRIEKLATPEEIYAGLHLMKRGFDEYWGLDCSILLSALHNPASDRRKIATMVNNLLPGMN
ncbi:MAG: DUF5063 domain-containing protein [Bacteroidia bacterium]|nr:DUF5063 domain-containing protein [Bacteroidia bacterium]